MFGFIGKRVKGHLIRKRLERVKFNLMSLTVDLEYLSYEHSQSDEMLALYYELLEEEKELKKILKDM